MKSLGPATYVTIGTLIAAVIGTVTVVRAIDGPGAELAAVRVQLAGVELQVIDLKARQDQGERQADERWDRVLADLGAIKERLGIVENRRAELASGK